MSNVMSSQKEKATPGLSSFCLAFGNFGLPGIKGYFKLSHLRNLCKIVEAQVYEFWFCVLDHGSSRSTSTIAVRWVKPPVSWAKLNTDGAVQGTVGLAGCGGLIRD